VPRPLRVLLAVLLVAALAVASACGGGDGAPAATAGGGTTAGGDAAATPATITSPGGAVCDGREPDPPADPRTYGAPPRREIEAGRSYTATLETSCGTIVVALDARRAPIAVNNFVALARDGFFDGLTFHRVVTGYIIQGGDPEGTGFGGPGYTFEDELPDDGYPAGSVAMANAGPNTNGSQFFIVTGDASALPNQFTRFGRVVKGLDVARRIEGFADPAADPGDPAAQSPTETIYIYRVTIGES
jgi:cyclophilin family peptidyl-prolyl cis-trans isomerase